MFEHIRNTLTGRRNAGNPSGDDRLEQLLRCNDSSQAAALTVALCASATAEHVAEQVAGYTFQQPAIRNAVINAVIEAAADAGCAPCTPLLAALHDCSQLPADDREFVSRCAATLDDDTATAWAQEAAHASVRTAAAQHVTTPANLRLLAQNARDKRVRQVSRQKLDALRALEVAAHEAQQKAEDIRAQLHRRYSSDDPLLGDYLSVAEQQLAQLAGQLSAALNEDLLSLMDAVQARLREKETERTATQEREQAISEHAAALDALNATIASLLQDAPDAATLAVLPAVITTQQQRWEAASHLIAPSEAVGRNFTSAMQQLTVMQDALRRLAQRDDWKAMLAAASHAPADLSAQRKLLDDIDTLLMHIDWPKALPTPQWFPLPTLRAALARTVDKATAEENSQQRSRLGKKLRFLQAEAGKRNLRNSQRLLADIDRLLEKTGIQPDARQQRQLDELRTTVHGLGDWAAFASDHARHALLTDMQTLAQKPLSPQRQYDMLRQLQSRWREASVGLEADDLDQQFEAAAHQAFAPCAEHFAKRDALLRAHRDARLRILSDLDTVLAKPDRFPAHELPALIRAAKEEWRANAPVSPADHASLQPRFDEAIDTIKKRLDALSEAAIPELQAKLDAAAQLQTQSDIEEACRHFAAQRKAFHIPPFMRHKEREQWQARFDRIGDALFAVRDSARKAHAEEKSADEARLSRTLAQLVDALADASSHDALTSAVRAFTSIKTEMQALEKQHRLATPLRKLLQDAEARINQARQQQAARERQTGLHQLLALIASAERGETTDEIPDALRRRCTLPEWILGNEKANFQSAAHALIALEHELHLPTPDAEQAMRQLWQARTLQAAMRGQRHDPDSLLLGLLATRLRSPPEEAVRNVSRWHAVISALENYFATDAAGSSGSR